MGMSEDNPRSNPNLTICKVKYIWVFRHSNIPKNDNANFKQVQISCNFQCEN